MHKLLLGESQQRHVGAQRPVTITKFFCVFELTGVEARLLEELEVDSLVNQRQADVGDHLVQELLFLNQVLHQAYTGLREVVENHNLHSMHEGVVRIDRQAGGGHNKVLAYNSLMLLCQVSNQLLEPLKLTA